MKGKGNLSFQSAKGPKGLTDAFYGCEKSRKNVLVLWFIDILKVRLQQFKNMQSSTIGMLKKYHLSIEDIRKGYLFSQKWYIKG